MYLQSKQKYKPTIANAHQATDHLTVSLLDGQEEEEVLDYLSRQVDYGFAMIGFIRSNGLVSEHNRGDFYGCRDQSGHLVGVALIGHFILFEADSDAVIKAFAVIAQGYKNASMLLGGQDKVESFWNYYSEGGQRARLCCQELLLQQKWPIEAQEPVFGLRLATIDDLDLIVPVHAQTVIAESGLDPLESDAEGFRRRCAHRIEQERTWVWVEDGKLIFKAEVVTDTPEIVYLEGVWVNPDERGKGFGSRCMLQLGKMFLNRSRTVCVLVNAKARAAQSFYKRIGYRLVNSYDTIFLSREGDKSN